MHTVKLKSGGINRSNTKTLETISSHITDPLKCVLNLCFENFPNALKIAEVVDIF